MVFTSPLEGEVAASLWTRRVGGEATTVVKRYPPPGGLDRDRAVDESGNQIGVFGRVGARPLNGAEQRRMYLRNGLPWNVTDNPRDAIYEERRRR